MRSRDLLDSRWPVAEEAPLARSHLEKTEVLAVLGTGVQTRFATRDSEGLLAVTSEGATDHALRGRDLDSGQLTGFGTARQCSLRCGSLSLRTGEAQRVDAHLAFCLDLEPGVAQKPTVRSEEPEHLPVLRQGAQVARQLSAEVCIGLRLGRRRHDQQNQGARAYH